MLSMPDQPPMENQAEPQAGLAAAFKDQLPAAGEQTVMVKVEDFQTLSQAGTDNGAGAAEQSQLWTSGLEKRGDATEQTVCVLLHDVKYDLSPAAAANQQQGFSPPVKDLPYLDGQEKEEMMHSDQFSVMGMQTLSAELPDHDIIQEVTVSDYSTVGGDQTQGRAAFEFNMTTVGEHEGCGSDNTTTRKNCFICSSCGQSFVNFNLFQRHQCKSVAE